MTETHSIPFPDLCPHGAFYTCYLSYPGSFYLRGLSVFGEAPSSPSAAATKQSEVNNLRQLAGISPMGSSAQIPELYYSKDSLCKGVPKEVTQTLVSPSDAQLLKGWGSFLEGQIPELVGPHSGNSLAGLQVKVPAFSHWFFSC